MSYFAPYVDATGLHIPTYNDILEKRIQDAKDIFGQDIYLGNDSADYQSISVEALALYEAMQAIQLAYNQASPVTAIGVGLSSLVQLNGLTRQPATYSTCDVVLRGTMAATIVNGVVMDVSGNKWTLPTPITLQAAGSPSGSYYELTVTAVCQSIGAISAMVGDLNSISTPTTGWTSVTNLLPAVPGVEVETDAELRERQSLSVALPSQTMLAGTIAGIASLPEVTRYEVYENATNSTHYGDPGVPFEGAPQHSITAVVEGGTVSDIANIVYYNRGLGCYTNGDVVTDIEDPDTGAVTPIRFYRPGYVSIYVEIEVHKLSTWTSDLEDAIKQAVVDYINSLGIGETLVNSSVLCSAVDVLVDKTKPSFSIKSLVMGVALSPPLTDEDIEVEYNEVVYGIVDDVEITYV